MTRNCLFEYCIDDWQVYSARVTLTNDDGSRPEAIIRSVARLAPHFAGQAKVKYIIILHVRFLNGHNRKITKRIS